MPYMIKREDDRYCVYKEGGGRVACHDTQAQAEDQMKALYASEDKAKVMNTKAVTAEEALAIIQDHLSQAIEEITSMLETEEVEEDVEATEEEVIEEILEEETDEAMHDEEEEKALSLKAIRAKLAKLVGSDKHYASSFKVHGNYFFARWSNNFEDRDGEYFSQKAIDNYIQRVDAGIVPKPELWAYHQPNTRHGEVKMVARVGNFVVSIGEFDDTPHAQKAKEYYAKAKDLGMSHGFTYDPERKINNVYHQFNTFEISTLPRDVAANPYTTFNAVKELTMDKKKQAYIEQVFGSDTAKQLLEDTEKAGKAIQEAGVAFKDFADIEQAQETVDVQEAAKNANQNYGTLLLQLTEDIATIVEEQINTSKSQKEFTSTLQAEVKALRDEVSKLQSALDMRPRSASKATETVVESSKLNEELKSAFVQRDDFWNANVKIK